MLHNKISRNRRERRMQTTQSEWRPYLRDTCYDEFYLFLERLVLLIDSCDGCTSVLLQRPESSLSAKQILPRWLLLFTLIWQGWLQGAHVGESHVRYESGTEAERRGQRPQRRKTKICEEARLHNDGTARNGEDVREGSGMLYQGERLSNARLASLYYMNNPTCQKLYECV